MELNETIINRIVNYIIATDDFRYNKDDSKDMNYRILRDAIRYAYERKLTYTETKNVINQLDLNGVIVPSMINYRKILLWKLTEQYMPNT